MPGIELQGFRIVVITRDERGHKPYVHVIKAGAKCKIVLDEALTPYDIIRMSKRDVARARELVGEHFGKFLKDWNKTMARAPARIPVPPLTDAIYERGQKTAETGPFDVVEARYDGKHDKLDLTLRKGITVSFPRAQIRELAGAATSDLANVEIQPGGDGITFRAIDVDISVSGLLMEELGTMFARELGRKTKGRTSRTKAAASRENGRKGGRPKTSPPSS